MRSTLLRCVVLVLVGCGDETALVVDSGPARGDGGSSDRDSGPLAGDGGVDVDAGVREVLMGLEFASMPLQLFYPHASGTAGMGDGSGLSSTNRLFKAYPGIEYAIPVVAVGGAPPAAYATVTCTSCEAGMVVEQYTTPAGAELGVANDAWRFRWPSPDTTRTAEIAYCDRNDNCVSATWQITVTTSGFKFVDASAGSNGEGTISSPYSAPSGNLGNAETGCVEGDILYFRAGTYTLNLDNEGGSFAADHWETDDSCVIWLAYPGEAVIVDGGYAEDGVDVPMVAFNFESNGVPPYVAGITFQSFKDKAIYLGNGDGDREFGFWLNTFTDIGPSCNCGSNSAVITYPQNFDTAGHPRGFTVANSFTHIDGMPYVKYYSVDYIADHHNLLGETDSRASEGIAYKADIGHISHVGNASAANADSMFFGGNQNQNASRRFQGEVAFNRYQREDTEETPCVFLNQNANSGNVNLYNNTFVCRITIWNLDDTIDGPFHFERNVINNSLGGSAIPHVDAPSATHPERAERVDELNGASVDSNGDLTGADLTNHGPGAPAADRRGHMIQ